jgi:D-alanyl-lipoteichoic acid acyltransferase DltB (MBOAT superfamily)
MQFTSLAFVLFLIPVFLIYWLIPSRFRVLQNYFLLGAGYFFYGWWDWRFLLLLGFVSVCGYFIGIRIHRSPDKRSRKRWLIAGIIVNLAVLSYFKYLGFFLGSVTDLLTFLGIRYHLPTLNIILPLGISFYIFLSLSYLIDVYRRHIEAVFRPEELLLSLSFFPIIQAGPIQRPITLLPQIRSNRIFSGDLAAEGLRRILLGVFMKLAIADPCADYVNGVFSHPGSESGSTLVMGAVFYAIQLYTDFAGYSEIAIGVAALFGFRLMRNFAYPYFASDIVDFWKRWHISLTSWFRDYIFLPLAYAISRRFKKEKVLFIRTDIVIYIIGITITWFLTGLWHGGGWTFIAWGAVHAVALSIHQILRVPRKKMLKKLGLKKENPVILTLDRTLTLGVVLISFIFFRSETLEKAGRYFSRIFDASLISVPRMIEPANVAIIIVFFVLEWFQRKQEYALQPGTWRIPVAIRWAFYYLLIFTLFAFGKSEQSFIYFQF